MGRLFWTRLVFLGGLFLLVESRPAAAQGFYSPPPVSPYQQPTLSPYLNLLRGGNIAANYFLGVLPDIQQRSINAQYGSAILNLERRTTQRPEAPTDELFPPLPSTGHPTFFMNYGPYYNLGSPRAGTAPAARSPIFPNRR
jgi:hypothetical protein